jgi:DNA-binding IclR family transcriptional regulator
VTDTARIATNQRLLLIVEALAAARRPLTPTELNVSIGLPKQSVHRLCHTLTDSGFLERAEDPRRLRPGKRLRKAAAGLLAASDVQIGIRQVLNQVAGVVREAVNFVVPAPDGMTYLDRVDTDWAFRIQLPVGSNVPFHCTASGKAYLASLPVRRRTALVRAMTLNNLARNTIVDPDALLTELDSVAQAGYAIDREEFMDDLVALAVPVLDENGGFLAALAFHGPSARVDAEAVLVHLDLLRNGAQKLRGILTD